jgi:nucleotide-binding universal stress UspA family protein
VKILLAVDNSSASREAVDQVCRRPWPKETSIEVLHVLEPMHLWATSETAQELTRLSQAVLDNAVATLSRQGHEPVGQLLEGDPKAVILDHASKVGADRIVLGARGATGIQQLLLGSVSSAVVRHAPCTVEVVRRRPGAPRAGWKILLATDGSESSELAALSVAWHPWPSGTEIRVLSAVEFAVPALLALAEPPGIQFKVNEERRLEAMKRAQDAVDAAARMVSVNYPKVSQSISVLLERPAKIILDEADRWDPDIIVVGSHGRQGMSHFLLGSVSEAVATHAKCSVEVVRKKAAQ